ncbi:serine/threonine-protein kinase [Amycolatopsis pigmentata]|uniref:non-specific serine/threonine protein kinase n=1 Tax=Amycolatopsis pigmentata TaxID=450801 RepID=A0ABW5G8T6_9PSEU
MVAGRYRLRSVLGSGSMGTVWSAYDDFLHRPVAVKEIRLPPGVTTVQADELRERTLREARAIAVLSHPNVIVLHDVARENGEPFVVMELLPSHSLAELLRDHGPLTIEQAAAVADAVAAALEAAHDAGITHRDVKPGNVLVADDGRIKLTDFGIARNVSEATMTRTGMTLGSPAYIAPEVASGRAVTPAADLWGLGATLFHVVEGRPPYDVDGDPLETVGKVVKGEVPRPGPGPLSPVITGLMAKHPHARMPLREVRRQLYPLLTKAPRVLFGPEMFRKASGRRSEATDTREIKAAPTPVPPATDSGGRLAADPGPLPFQRAENSGSRLAAEPGPLPFQRAENSGSGLAADPGPPPFQPTGQPAASPVVGPGRPQRRGLAGAVLTVTAIVLFLVSAVGGFVAARAIGGQPLTPATGAPSAPAQSAPLRFEVKEGNASSVRGQDAKFTIEAPTEWQRFTSSQAGDGLPPSTLVQWVSPDGTQMLAVDHFPTYFAQADTGIQLYLAGLTRSGNVKVLSAVAQSTPSNMLITYRTISSGEGGQITRTTFAKTRREGDSLWTVSVTVPIEQEQAAKAALFDRMAPTFKLVS